MLVTKETMIEYNQVHNQIYKKPENTVVLSNQNINNFRTDKLLIRLIRRKQSLSNIIPESFITITKIPEPYARHKCFSIVTNNEGYEIIYFHMKDHLKVLLLEIMRWISAPCFVTYCHVAFVNIFHLISDINTYVSPDEQHAEWLRELNTITFITNSNLSLTESRQIINYIYDKVYQMCVIHNVLPSNVRDIFHGITSLRNHTK
jgi:hypothetical protein